ncbi:asparagine synthase (glutamine-hydrolyzing) [Chitinophagaceae bacterium IBVUCB1]|nr:asparagine synthase (glutamine-hydrolyzing) [Chitinophagaceae bacterium IBVUCB1]
MLHTKRCVASPRWLPLRRVRYIMCGISGIVAKQAVRYKVDLSSMIAAMHHRGPDGNGQYHFENCLLGHNRLSIVDIATGNQPMHDDTGSICIVFNGEIYGYKELRSQLNYPFKTNSDTELIIAMYKQYGIGMLNRLPGMFAFAIWDNDKQQLFAARDRFGEKPFYYSIKENEMVFASEIKAINRTSFCNSEINRQALSKYLTHGYTGPSMSIYNSVNVLPAAHYLVYNSTGLTISRYWQLPIENTNISLSDAADKFQSLFDDAVKKQMVADVECCAFLSGGLDSSSVVSAAKSVNNTLKTLTYGYKGEDSELPYARLVADMYATHHIEMMEENVSVSEVLQKIATVYDEPFGDSSAVATYLICKEAKKHGKVVLTGDGADELLGGYVWWYQPIIKQLECNDNNALKYAFVHMAALAEKAIELITGNTANRNWRDKYHYSQSGKKYPTPLAAIQSRFDGLPASSLQALELPERQPMFAEWVEDGTINDAMKFDISDYMPGDILVKTDRASMANSIELRAPFLDVALAEFCISMPGYYKVTSNADKILLREAMQMRWPLQIRERSKQGFGLVKNTWSGTKEMQVLYNDYVMAQSSPLYNVLPYKQTQNLLRNKPAMLHSLLVLALWADKNL